ncbi:MAG: phosphoribosylformylglycinamidine synthase [Paludibacteraceae bacterium]|nr:phosphoribosylformylglycinamidine synthase [Paludibacteraceae bacterium]
MKYRVSVEKKAEYQIEARSLQNELNEIFALKIDGLRILNIYDIEGFTPKLIEKAKYGVFGEMATDVVSVLNEHEALMESLVATNPLFAPQSNIGSCFAIESLPGQFDQRAASAVDCIHLIDPEAKVKISVARLIVFPKKLSAQQLDKIKEYCINRVECREKNLRKVGIEPIVNDETPVREFVEGFRSLDKRGLNALIKERGLAINVDDLLCIQDYFNKESREPTLTELMILDTYWSDHCRHTTFNTIIDKLEVEDSFIADDIRGTYRRYDVMRRSIRRDRKPHTLMDMGTIGARWLLSNGYLDDLEKSEENNACSIFITVNVKRRNSVTAEKWLLQFKNETHNHPTEIEPFGGAATCLGGAIRDPLSGRAYVYQAMRVTGASDIYAPIKKTLAGKLPQRLISRKAAQGYSSYGNQIGLATTHVSEIHHPDYVAKRMEVGAVVGASPVSNVRRESPQPGDVVLMLGGRTGRDGVGGASGSSKKHDDQSLTTCGSEVQKGNAPEERKLQRLMRRTDAASLIKKANDFGAGGVSVAVGELADGLEIFLDRVKTKYDGLTTTELAISESQERMAVVVDANDAARFTSICAEENIEVVHIANVTANPRMKIYFKDQVVVDLSRVFIDSAGAERHTNVMIPAVEDIDPFDRKVIGINIEKRFISNLRDPNVQIQKGMVEMFDATIGATTVLMPFGGKLQRSPSQVSVQKVPLLDGTTDDASMMAYGFDPYLSKWSPYHGAAYAVVDACAKVVAAGGDFTKIRFSFQEYFQKLTGERSWGLPAAALLGALKMQRSLKLPSIGGKDSMSGTFENINVPPTLIAFGVTMVDANNVISTDFYKEPGVKKYVYILRHRPYRNYMPESNQLRRNFAYMHELIVAGKVDAAYAIGRGGVAEAVAKMAFGSNVGATVTYKDLFTTLYGSFLFTSEDPELNASLIGELRDDDNLVVNGVVLPIEKLYKEATSIYSSVYPINEKRVDEPLPSPTPLKEKLSAPLETLNPVVYIPIFPGTNCDYDLARAFREAGATVKTSVFRNLTARDINESINEMADNIAQCNILAFAGGFSAGDEPDGSAKFIATVINNAKIANQIDALIDRKCLILGICNGFQALVKSGLLPYGRLNSLTHNSPTLFRNDCNRHISQMVTTRVCSLKSPWLQGFEPHQEHTVAVSHGEGKFVCSQTMAEKLVKNGQVAFQYVENPNGSTIGIEGLISPDGLILGKMAHSERRGENLFLNIQGNLNQDIFKNAVDYFRHK